MTKCTLRNPYLTSLTFTKQGTGLGKFCSGLSNERYYAEILDANQTLLCLCQLRAAGVRLCPTGVTSVKTAQAPVVVDDTVREAQPNDYLRVSFVPAGVKVTTLSRPGALRAFATATPLFCRR